MFGGNIQKLIQFIYTATESWIIKGLDYNELNKTDHLLNYTALFEVRDEIWTQRKGSNKSLKEWCMSVKGANFGESYEEQFRLCSLFCNF